MNIDLNKKTIIFDFDGTIADTFERILDELDQYSGDFGVELADEKLLEELRSMSAIDIFKKFRIPIFMAPIITKKVQKKLGEDIETIYPFYDVIKEIKSIRDKYNIGVLTSNSKENVQKFLSKEKISELFDFIYSEKSLFGKHKILKKLLSKFKLRRDDVIYIGDEARDVEACRKADVTVISVGWGFNSKKLLNKINGNNFIETPKELGKKISEILNQ